MFGFRRYYPARFVFPAITAVFVFIALPVLLWLWNSVKVGMIASAGILLLSTTAAYAFSRMRFRGKGGILDSLLIIQMFPAALTLIAL